jgi:V8-like Glu-specific endopeptidase
VIGTSRVVEVVPDLFEAVPDGGQQLWTQSIAVPGAAFLKLHFVDVNLYSSDFLTIRSASGKVVEEVIDRGPKNLGTFWALSSFGEKVTIEFRFSQSYSHRPFRIDQVIVGDASLFDPVAGGGESICTPADFEDVICYQGDAAKWANIQACVGVMSVGGNPATALFCSGSNVSPLNYLLTNFHCMENQSQCDTAEYVFKYYRTGCNDGSPPTVDWQSFRCDQQLATSPYISCDQGLSDLDYSLSSVIGDPAATFGYVQADPNPLTDGEDIYIVQHPAGRPHEITHGGGADVDVDGTVLRYYTTLDTEGGSSGSPIFREADDLLIGLHHCGGCSTPGTGNRGMLMADIYPEIAGFLCSETLSLGASSPEGLAEVSGNNDGILQPGEIWETVPRVTNRACDLDAFDVTADVAVNPGSVGVTLLDTTASFGDILAGQTAPAVSSIRFRVDSLAGCGESVILDLVNITASNGGPFGDAPEFLQLNLGEEPLTTAYLEDFTFGLGAWTIVDGGSGGGSAATWTSANPGGRSLSLTAPWAIVDSDAAGTSATQDETLTSGLVDVSGYSVVRLQFNHDFTWYSGGLDEQADVDVRSSATGGVWVNVANYSGGSASGMVTLDISAEAAGQSDLQVRFHYYNGSYEWWWAIDDVFVLGSNGFVCDNGSFTPYGVGCEGTGGLVPVLEGLGSATTDAEFTLRIRDSLPSTLGVLMFSLADDPSATPCTTQVGFPLLYRLVIFPDAFGEWSLTALGFDPLLPTDLYMQALIKDSGAASGKFSYTNGLDMLLRP